MTIVGDLVTGQPVSFKRLRQMMEDQGGGLQEGVVNATDLKVVQRAAGANMSVDIGVGQAWIHIDTGSLNGLSHAYSDAVENRTITAAHATLPRVDQAVLGYNDTAIPAGTGGNTPTLAILTGTATSGATLDNRTGAAALPNDCVRLADILVGAAVSSIVNANIRDRRPWARGAFNRILRTQNAAAGSDYTFTGAVALLDATNLQPRIECSGMPIRVTFRGRLSGNASAHHARQAVFVDGVNVDSITSGESIWRQWLNGTSEAAGTFEHIFIPSAGSHLIGIAAGTDTGSDFFFARAGVPCYMTVEEIIRQNSNNS